MVVPAVYQLGGHFTFILSCRQKKYSLGIWESGHCMLGCLWLAPALHLRLRLHALPAGQQAQPYHGSCMALRACEQ